MDKGWYDGIAEGVRLQSTADDEGGTWVLFLDEDRRPVNAMAVPRSDGQPRAEDWRLWEESRKRMAVARPELIDLVVVGEQSWWAAVGAT
jgi:hypothetical protein